MAGGALEDIAASREEKPTADLDRPSPTGTIEKIIIRPYSEIVVCYPTLVVAWVCSLAATIFSQSPTTLGLIAAVFIVVFFLNTIVLAFDFPRMTGFVVVLLVASVLLAMILLNRYLNTFHFLMWLLSFLHPLANNHFYALVGSIYLFAFGVAWIITRFDYWEVLNNELIHHHGPLSDIERFPAPQLKLDKEIPDIFEYAFLRSGRLIFYPTSERRAIIVETVLNVNRVEARIKELLGVLDVRLEANHL